MCMSCHMRNSHHEGEASATQLVYIRCWSHPSAAQELLFLSKEAVFKPPKAIR